MLATGAAQVEEMLISAFTIFQYFLRVVPTTYIDANRRRLATSQVSGRCCPTFVNRSQ